MLWLDGTRPRPQFSPMALDDTIRQLAEIAILRPLDRDALRLLAFSAETRLLRTGDVLFREGDESDGGFFLTSGSCDLQALHDTRPLRVVAPTLLGEAALFVQTIRPATATAAAPCTILRISRALFRRVLEEYPSGAMKIRAALAGRISDYADDLARFANNDR